MSFIFENFQSSAWGFSFFHFSDYSAHKSNSAPKSTTPYQPNQTNMSFNLPFVTQEEEATMVPTIFRNAPAAELALPKPKPPPKYIQLNFFGAPNPPSSPGSIQVKAHVKKNGVKVSAHSRKVKGKRSSLKNKGTYFKNNQSFVAPDDCKESRALAIKLHLQDIQEWKQSSNIQNK